MKKHFLATVLLMLLIPIPDILSQAFGIKGGLNFPSMLVKDDVETYSDNNKIKFGFHIGGVVDVPITDVFSVEGSLLFCLKGGKSVEEFQDYKYTVNANLFYFHIPVTIKYTYDLGNLKLYGMAGPYIALGISGKYKTIIEYGGDEETDNEAVDWGTDSENDDLKRTDGGLHIGAGVRIGSIQAGLFYELGLFNISPYTGDGYLIKNRSFGLTASYFFGK
jgi:hypothetical protein